MAHTSRRFSLLLVTLATASLAYQAPFYVRPTPAPADLPDLQPRQTAPPTSSVDPVVESCSMAVWSFLHLAPSVDEDLFVWLGENHSGSCRDFPSTVTPPASLVSALSSLESHVSSFRCQEHSLLDTLWKTCAKLPQFSDNFTALPEGCDLYSPCEDGWDKGGDEGEDGRDGGRDEGEDDTEGGSGSGDGGSGDQDDGDGDSDSAASSQVGVGAAAAAAVAGSIALAALRL